MKKVIIEFNVEVGGEVGLIKELIRAHLPSTNFREIDFADEFNEIPTTKEMEAFFKNLMPYSILTFNGTEYTLQTGVTRNSSGQDTGFGDQEEADARRNGEGSMYV